MTRVFSLLLVCVFARGESLESAAGALAKKIAPHLQASETAHLTSRNLSSLAAGEVAKAQAALDRELRKRVRNPAPVDVTLTISENLRGFLLVAEIKKTGETAVEMIEYHPDPAAPQVRSTLTIEKKLLWEQDTPILDLVVMEDQMLVLDPHGVTRYESRSGRWERVEEAAVTPFNVRDPRGRMEANADALSVRVPGAVCAGSWRPKLELHCQDGGEFTASRNTIDFHDARGSFLNSAEIGGEQIVAELDGRAHVYDAAHTARAVFDNWGSDFAIVESACGGNRIAASSASDRQSADSISLYEIVNESPARVSEPAEFPGPVTALWPARGGALAVAKNLGVPKYAAYRISIDCGR